LSMGTRVCAISFKECWQDNAGVWYSDGGFPLQMGAIESLFDSMTLLITRRETPGQGGLCLPRAADIVALRRPTGRDLLRKIDVAGNLAYYCSTIARYIRSADVVHVPVPGDIPLLGMLIAIKLRKRLIVRYCGSWAITGQTTFMNRVTCALMRRFAGGRNVMLATGEAEALPGPNMHWIFATAQTMEELARIVPRFERGLGDPPRLAYVGRLSPEKGVVNLLEAVALLEREYFEPLPLVFLIGDGPERGALEERVATLQRPDRITFTGQLDREGLSEALAQMDLCVQASLTEGFSKAWLDAFAHGLPVVATDVGAARWVIGSENERGWLVEPGDSRSLALQLKSILSQPREWPTLRRRCRAYAEARTLESWARQIGAICERQWAMPLREGRITP
jgi:glycosyltransferase involved in cell wall biosynthesis